ncbi:MAG: FAD binding domain-containing protein [Cyclobacteriaceae bacterium]
MEFILNHKTVSTDHPSGMTLLDFIRYEQALTGTKIGCREGDCGACTVLVGGIEDGRLSYQSMTSCLVPIMNVEGKHVVTIEGLNMNHLTPVQQAMVEEGGTQCGFCTVGFVVSLSGYALEAEDPNYEAAIGAMDGNICRCTGYKSIERAAGRLVAQLKNKKVKDPIPWLVEEKFIPKYFSEIPERLSALNPVHKILDNGQDGSPMVGGGTDLYVQRPDDLVVEKVHSFHQQEELKGIALDGKVCTIGGATTVTDLLESNVFQSMFPDLKKHLKLVSSTPIRNMSTVGGNFVNASPIGDLTIFFLALDSSITLAQSDGSQREVDLKDLYRGYKDLDKSKNEYIKSINFNVLQPGCRFNFEKVSKRTYLDIASVNTALQIQLNGEGIVHAHVSAGGVSPIPMYLKETCSFLSGKSLLPENVSRAAEVMQQEVAPISDARGSKEYKRLLLRQLFLAHFITLFPEKMELEELV